MRADGVPRNTPNMGLYIPPMVWGTEFQYSFDAVLGVLAFRRYDADDYIRKYENLKVV